MYNITVRSGNKILSSHVSHEPLTSIEETALLAVAGDPDAFIDICRIEEDVELEPIYEDSI